MNRIVEEIDGPRGVFHVSEKLRLGNAAASLGAALLETIEEALVSEAHGDNQFGRFRPSAGAQAQKKQPRAGIPHRRIPGRASDPAP